MKAATHNGTCQVCGRSHAVNPDSNTIVNHGYTVDHGYFNGICGGTDHLPLEVSRAYTDEMVAHWNAMAAAHAAKTAADITTVATRARKNLSDRYLTVMNVTADNAADHGKDWERLVHLQLQNEQSRARHLTAHAAMMAEFADKVHGQPLANREQVARAEAAAKAEKASQPTQASVQRKIDTCKGVYGQIRDEAMKALLNERGSEHVAVNELYWDLPSDLHLYRDAKFGDRILPYVGKDNRSILRELETMRAELGAELKAIRAAKKAA